MQPIDMPVRRGEVRSGQDKHRPRLPRPARSVNGNSAVTTSQRSKSIIGRGVLRAVPLREQRRQRREVPPCEPRSAVSRDHDRLAAPLLHRVPEALRRPRRPAAGPRVGRPSAPSRILTKRTGVPSINSSDRRILRQRQNALDRPRITFDMLCPDARCRGWSCRSSASSSDRLAPYTRAGGHTSRGGVGVGCIAPVPPGSARGSPAPPRGCWCPARRSPRPRPSFRKP